MERLLQLDLATEAQKLESEAEGLRKDISLAKDIADQISTSIQIAQSKLEHLDLLESNLEVTSLLEKLTIILLSFGITSIDKVAFNVLLDALDGDSKTNSVFKLDVKSFLQLANYYFFLIKYKWK